MKLHYQELSSIDCKCLRFESIGLSGSHTHYGCARDSGDGRGDNNQTLGPVAACVHHCVETSPTYPDAPKGGTMNAMNPRLRRSRTEISDDLTTSGELVGTGNDGDIITQLTSSPSFADEIAERFDSDPDATDRR